MLNAWFNKFPEFKYETSQHTTDVPELERCEHHHVFIIDDLQRGRRNHKILAPIWNNGVEWLATGFTESLFHCWKRIPGKDNNFEVEQSTIVPLTKKDQNNISEWSTENRFENRFNHWAKIKGELWKVHHSRIIELDSWMMNNVLFKRQRVIIEVPLKEVTSTGVNRIISEQEAFMYIGISEVWEPMLDGGYLFQPMSIFTNSNLNRKYYSYTKLEDNE